MGLHRKLEFMTYGENCRSEGETRGVAKGYKLGLEKAKEIADISFDKLEKYKKESNRDDDYTDGIERAQMELKIDLEKAIGGGNNE